MIGLEDHILYDRPSLSKQYLAGKKQAEAHLMKFNDINGIYPISSVDNNV